MENVLEVKNLTVAYPAGINKSKVIIDAFSLEVSKGSMVGLLGPNGAGKTTLIKSILGLINPQKGKIALFGECPPPVSIKTKIGYQPEVSTYYWFLTPAELLLMYGRLCDMPLPEIGRRSDLVLNLVGLYSEKDRLIKTFSKGMQQKLGLAQALLHDPQFLILDEPFSGLDPIARIHVREILKDLKKENKTIFLSSHELSEAELICDHICIMKNGRVLKYDSLNNILSGKNEESLERYFINVVGGKNE
jgi:ABC-2 type transport system ATP-binding protein